MTIQEEEVERSESESSFGTDEDISQMSKDDWIFFQMKKDT